MPNNLLFHQFCLQQTFYIQFDSSDFFTSLKSYDAHLPSFHKAREEHELMNRVLTKSETDRYWVGLSWNYYGGYHWSDAGSKDFFDPHATY